MLEYANRQQVWQQLWDQLAKAREVHVTASARFDLLVNAGPSGLPHPDGSLLIQNANREANMALQCYIQALKRFSDFTLYGKVPADLLPPEEPKRTAAE